MACTRKKGKVIAKIYGKIIAIKTGVTCQIGQLIKPGKSNK